MADEPRALGMSRDARLLSARAGPARHADIVSGMTPSTFTTPSCGTSKLRVRLEQRHGAGRISDAEYLKWSAKLDAVKTIRPSRWVRMLAIIVATAVVSWILVTVALNALPR